MDEPLDVVRYLIPVGARTNVLVERLTDGETVGSARTNAAMNTRPQMSSRKAMGNDSWKLGRAKKDYQEGRQTLVFGLTVQVHRMLTCGKQFQYILQIPAVQSSSTTVPDWKHSLEVASDSDANGGSYIKSGRCVVGAKIRIF